jgi:5'-3' exonuclease
LSWSSALDIHLIDGTYELFRHFYALPSARDSDGREIAAVRGVVTSVLGMINAGASHIAVATDHVIESFRNDLWPGYKTGAGIDRELFAQFELLEDVLSAAGVVVWPMVEFEADDALAAAAARAADDPRVGRVIVCTPDKDLAQCVRGGRVVQLNRRTRVTLDEAGVVAKFGVPPASIPDYLALVGDRVVQLDRRQQTVRDEAGVIEKFGVPPASIPDYLALVGDTADGFPGIPGWGAKSTATVLAHYLQLEAIPALAKDWDVDVRGATKLATNLAAQRDDADLFKVLATLREDADVGDVDDWCWTGPADDFEDWCERLGATGMVARAQKLAEKRS